MTTSPEDSCDRRVRDGRQRRPIVRKARPRSTPARRRARAAPKPGPGAMPRPTKSADLSGKTGALQRDGKVASECQCAIRRASDERVQASSTRSV